MSNDKIIDMNEASQSLTTTTQQWYEIKKEEPGKIECEIWTSTDKIFPEIERQIDEACDNLEMAGFQKGRVPKKIARQKVAGDIMSKILDKEIAKLLHRFIKEKNIVISAPPEIEVTEFDRDKRLACYVKFQIIENVPDIDFSDPILKEKIDGNIVILELEVVRDDINKALEALKNATNEYIDTDTDYQSQINDKLVIDFDGRVDSNTFEGGTGSQVEIVLGSQNFIPGFEEQLVGIKANETKIIKVNFPQDYHESSVAGKEGIFKVVVHSVKKAVPTEFDDEFAKNIGLESREQFEEMIGERLKADFSFLSHLYAKKQLFELLDKNVDLEVSPNMVKIDFENLWYELRDKLSAEMQGLSRDELAVNVMEISRRRVKIGLLLSEIARKYEITATDEDIEDYKRIEILRNPADEQKIEQQYSDKKSRPKIEATVLEDKAIRFILNCFENKIVKVTSQQFNEEYADKLQDVFS